MSKIIAIMPCRNSAWCLGLTSRVTLMFCDELHVLNHASTDGTAQIIADLQAEYPGRVEALRIDSGIWAEMAHRNLLLESARANGATHIWTGDDDELPTGNLLPNIRQMAECTPRGQILQLPWLQLRDGIDKVIHSGMWGRQSASCAFADEPAWHWKPYGPAQYQHHHRHPMGRPFLPHAYQGSGGLLHLQMASRERLLWKHRWYELTERLRWPSKPVAEIAAMYSRTVNECASATVTTAWPEWWESYSPLMQHLHLDAEPWQKADALRIIRENPGIEKGLTDYGRGLRG